MTMTELLEKLTIAIPVYNDVKYIGRTIETCLTEAGKIVIYDNASDDGTSDVCAAFAKEHPHVTHIRHAENVGAFENFKRPLFDCDTEYFSWVGSHDLLGKNYAAPILKEMEKDPAAILAVGTIRHIDENGTETGRVSISRWVNKTRNKPPLKRLANCVANLKDCFMIYGVFRTDGLRKAWIDHALLGHDRVMLTKLAGHGNFLYVPGSIFYARNQDKARDAAKDQERRTEVLVAAKEKPLEKSLLPRNLGMVETVLSFVESDKDLKKALKIIDKINRRYVNRRYYQKLRLVKIAAMLLAGALLFWLWRI
ncbi:MAG: glycosyltransferase family 2 protein [Proteobacteria bacterium]|nr:glycosyltransferase family 2 protein [Pseudomonadota bacterium]